MHPVAYHRGVIDRLLPRRRRPVLAVVAACSALGLSACGLQPAATAAKVDDTVITVSDVDSWVDDYAEHAGMGQLSDTAAAEATTRILGQRVQAAVFEELAAELDITVTEAEINQEVGQFRSQINQMPEQQYQGWVTENYVTRDTLSEVLRTEVLAMRIGEELQDGADLVRVFEEHGIDVTVNPRFGTWDPESGLDPSGGALVDLSGAGEEGAGEAGDELPPANP